MPIKKTTKKQKEETKVEPTVSKDPLEEIVGKQYRSVSIVAASLRSDGVVSLELENGTTTLVPSVEDLIKVIG